MLRGTCHALFAFDVGREIALSRAESRLSSPVHKATFRHKHRAALGTEPMVRPLRVSLPEAERPVGAFATGEGTEVTLWSFGALGVQWRIPVRASMEDLVGLAACLYANEDLRSRSREVCGRVVEALGDALLQPGVADEVEDYLIFQVRPEEGVVPSRRDLARLLRAEPGELSAQEVENALANEVSYAEGDACYVDWLGAVLLGEDTEDERRVLEFTTIELLELRFLEAQVGRGVDEAYVSLRRMRGGLRGLVPQSRELERLARLEADNAVLHDSIDNASKFLGDDYLARLYRTASERFYFAEWDASIQRKLQVLHGIYSRLEEVASRRRSEILEWVIIVLIAADIVISLLPHR